MKKTVYLSPEMEIILGNLEGEYILCTSLGAGSEGFVEEDLFGDLN